MAIVQVNDKSTNTGNAKEVCSNAPTNDSAIAEIEAYCAENALSRAQWKNLEYRDDAEHGRIYICLCQ